MADTAHHLIAILRGVRPNEIEKITITLIERGFRAIEVTLNSPDPFSSISKAVKIAKDMVGESALIGAGTVLCKDDVDGVVHVGGNLIVSPNCNPEVIRYSAFAGMVTFPGVFTPTEAFQALDNGASAIKIFPASTLGPSGISAMTAVLPKATKIYAVGGIDAADFASYSHVGTFGFGLGSCLYRAGMSAEDVGANADRLMAAQKALRPSR